MAIQLGTRSQIDAFQHEIVKAEELGENSFLYDGSLIYVNYAKHVVQYALSVLPEEGDYLVIELWENAAPSLVQQEDGEVFHTEHLNEALEEASDCQDGYVLDFVNMKIIKP